MKIRYEKLIPYPFETVLSQYFDYEHIEHVHPKTLGRYEVVSNEGNVIVYDQIWPGRRGKRSRVRQTFDPPGDIRFEFAEGLHKGTVVESKLSEAEGGTWVDETYIIPGLPDWNWLKVLIRPMVMKSVNRIWDEDLSVEVCRDGWPGVPGAAPPAGISESEAVGGDAWAEVGPAAGFRGEGPWRVEANGMELALIRDGGRWLAMEGRCPHAGAPLHLGKVCDGALVCPWHGARIEAGTGKPLSGPVNRPLKVFPARERDGNLEIPAPRLR